MVFLVATPRKGRVVPFGDRLRLESGIAQRPLRFGLPRFGSVALSSQKMTGQQHTGTLWWTANLGGDSCPSTVEMAGHQIHGHVVWFPDVSSGSPQ